MVVKGPYLNRRDIKLIIIIKSKHFQMSICEIFPDDPTCAPVAAPEIEEVVATPDVVEEEGMAGMEEGEKMDSISSASGQRLNGLVRTCLTRIYKPEVLGMSYQHAEYAKLSRLTIDCDRPQSSSISFSTHVPTSCILAFVYIKTIRIKI